MLDNSRYNIIVQSETTKTKKSKINARYVSRGGLLDSRQNEQSLSVIMR